MTKLQILGLIAFVLVLGFVGRIDEQTQEIQAAGNVCVNQDAYTTPTFDQCMNNQFENNGDH